MVGSWRGGAGCKCEGPTSCEFPLDCCKREGGPGQQRAWRRPNADGTLTLCLCCAGASGAVRGERPRRRPAASAPAAQQPPAVKAKAGAPPPLAAPAAAQASAQAAHTAALLGFTVAAAQLTTALDAHRLALRDYLAAQGASAKATAAAPPALAPAAAAAPLALAPAAARPACPRRLLQLKGALETALGGSARPRGEAVLQAAGAGSSAAAWARLRALLAVYFPDCDRVSDVQLEERARSARVARGWMESGQLHQLVVSGPDSPATIVNHVARHLRKNQQLLTRFGPRLLADAASLKAD